MSVWNRKMKINGCSFHIVTGFPLKAGSVKSDHQAHAWAKNDNKKNSCIKSTIQEIYWSYHHKHFCKLKVDSHLFEKNISSAH